MRAVLLILSVLARSCGTSDVGQFWAKAPLFPVSHYLQEEEALQKHKMKTEECKDELFGADISPRVL